MVKTGTKVHILVDKADEPLVNEYRWFIHTAPSGGKYVRGYHKGSANRNTRVYMHQLIMGRRRGYVIDHVNGNSLDNRRSNLRFCTRQQNAFNRLAKSGHRGITWNKQYQRWVARIQHQGRAHFIGKYTELQHGIIAYNAVAKVLYGEYATKQVWLEA